MAKQFVPKEEFDELDKKHHELIDRVKEVEDFKQGLETLVELKTDLEDLLSVLKSARGFFVVLGWIGKVVKWISTITVAISLGYASVTGLSK